LEKSFPAGMFAETSSSSSVSCFAQVFVEQGVNLPNAAKHFRSSMTQRLGEGLLICFFWNALSTINAEKLAQIEHLSCCENGSAAKPLERSTSQEDFAVRRLWGRSRI